LCRPGWIVSILVSPYVALLLVVAWFGRPNSDEGWYIYASHLVYDGGLPYRDFAFTQGPALPYVYGLPQLVRESLIVGRLTSVAFGAAAVGLCVATARRKEGTKSAVVTATLLLAYSPGWYFFAITKTYALVAACWAGAAYVLTAIRNDEVRLPLSVALCSLAVLVRVSAIFVLIALLVYVAMQRPSTRALQRVLFVVLAFAGTSLAFVVAAPHAALFDLFEYHQLGWSHLGFTEKLLKVVERGLRTAKDLAPWCLLGLGITAGACVSDTVRSFLAHHRDLAVICLGALAFVAGQSVSGSYYAEYVVPAVPILITFSALVLVALPIWKHTMAWVAATSLAVLLVVTSDLPPITYQDGKTPLAQIQGIGELVEARTRPVDTVLTLEAQWINVIAHRPAVPDVSLAQFSYLDVSGRLASERHYVNHASLVAAVSCARPAAVVLTGDDFSLMAFAGMWSARRANSDAFIKPLRINYDLIRTERLMDQGTSVHVYLRHTPTAPRVRCPSREPGRA
jgi:hypothetical protein